MSTDTKINLFYENGIFQRKENNEVIYYIYFSLSMTDCRGHDYINYRQLRIPKKRRKKLK